MAEGVAIVKDNKKLDYIEHLLQTPCFRAEKKRRKRLINSM